MEPADDRPQVPDGHPLWSDSFHLDFVAADGQAGGFLHLSLWPGERRAWWWSHLVTPEGLVAVRDHEVPLPRSGLEVRADGLWAAITCEVPLEHWTYGLEAFGLRYDDPYEAFASEWGERMPVGLDLEWELTGPPAPGPLPGPGGALGGHTQPGLVRGELLVGTGVFPFEGTGCRSRRWGPADWWSGPRRWSAAVTDDGDLIPSPEGGEVLAVAAIPVTAPGRSPARLVRSMFRTGGAAGWREELDP